MSGTQVPSKQRSIPSQTSKSSQREPSGRITLAGHLPAPSQYSAGSQSEPERQSTVAGSAAHRSEQQSPLSRLPSSHSSPRPSTPSPQIGGRTVNTVGSAAPPSAGSSVDTLDSLTPSESASKETVPW